MLDDNSVIKQRDPQDFLGFAVQEPLQLAHDYGIAKNTSFSEIKNVVFAGMGGSGLPAELLKSYPTLSVPFVVSKGYDLPEFVDKNTLVICDSFSGNTEETIEVLGKARKASAQIAIITNGGQILDLAKEGGEVLAKVPDFPQPRAAVFYMYRAAVEILVAAKVAQSGAIDELNKVASKLNQVINQWKSDIPTEHNLAKQIAQKMAGKTAIIYGGTLMYPAAYKWKIDVNENAKNTAWCNYLPEFNHNEFIGWSSHPIEKPFAVINLLSSFENPRVQKRFDVTERLLSGKRPESINVEAKGETLFEHIAYAILLGDFTTIYLAILNGVNPTPVDLVEKFKEELK